ncbi:orotate phosphoribosyltransferase [Breznakia pachnodae]|uniref:Orotate phosphoribosyltransferase n=1 Tax=Breznakia pachnodae TaxID=265178 RepID=A0ABU0E5P3_9FIRM|nr:orotate phosphoribosyltransferase [Breznakia pachnodae]MDQ0362200.1 orotate phosphoribosyltransferase [Breznakia pachnodae]
MEKLIAKNLLEAEAVFLRPNDPFTWASGIQSPIYCDNRLILSYPDKRTAVVEGFVKLIKKEYPDVEVIMGTATAGIPWAAMVADKMGLPMGYVRGSNKAHGKGNKIEGKVDANAKVVIIEDLISTGGSVRDVVDSLRDANTHVLGVAAIFTYLLPKATSAFEDMKCELRTLSDYDYLLEAALELDYIKDRDLQKLKAFKNNPNDSAWMDL